MLVFGYSEETTIPKDEITLWRQVRFIDIQQEIKYIKSDKNLRDDEAVLKLYLFEYLFEEEYIDKAIFIQSGFLFNNNLLRIDNGVGTGYEIYTKTGGYIKSKLNTFRGLKDDEFQVIYPMSNNLILSRVTIKSKWTCSIKIRSELIFSGLLTEKPIKTTTTETRVALLIPVKNENDRIEDCAILNYLIPSLDHTVADISDVTLYIGYDEGDPLFKDKVNRDRISDSSSFNVQFYELPKTGWLTFIWNFLLVEAFKDGNEYFVQLNDDVEFLENDWLSSSISMLSKEDKGVIGFYDVTWQCKLYTQTLVNRNHYKIFKGQYFPLTLRNWYSDDWITSVYKDHGGICNEDAVISNGNVRTRYTRCDARNYKSSLIEGLKLINE